MAEIALVPFAGGRRSRAAGLPSYVAFQHTSMHPAAVAGHALPDAVTKTGLFAKRKPSGRASRLREPSAGGRAQLRCCR